MADQEVLDRDVIQTKNFKATKAEIVDVLAGNIPALGTLLRILDIQPSEDVPTAGVPRNGIPIIYYNPKFVDEHCETKVHFAMLLLHEIYHILLGHTLGRAKTDKDNVIADAIINAMISLQYPGFGFQSFFMNYYKEDEMPYAFLRPKARPPKFWQRRKYQQLYTIMGVPWEDLVEVFRNEELPGETRLLGTHDGSGEGEGELLPDVVMDSIAESMMDDMASKVKEINDERLNKLGNQRWRDQHTRDDLEWKKKYGGQLTPEDEQKLKRAQEHVSNLDEEINAIKSAGVNASLFVRILRTRLDVSKKKKELEEELRKVAQQSIYSKLECKLKGMFPKIPETSVVPNFRNRRAIVSLVSGNYQPFFKNLLRPKDFGAVTIYIDVSGSMNGFISTIYKLACNCKDYLDNAIFLFSNRVEKITKDDLLKGVIRSTGGTDDCWLEHALDNGKKKIFLFTDGYLSIRPELIERLKKTGTRVIVAYTPNHQRLPKEVAHSELIMGLDGEAKKMKGEGPF